MIADATIWYFDFSAIIFGSVNQNGLIVSGYSVSYYGFGWGIGCQDEFLFHS